MDQPDQHHSVSEPIGDSDAHLLMAVFGLSRALVMADARRVAASGESGDSLLVGLRKRHAWDTQTALSYFGALRRALDRQPDRP